MKKKLRYTPASGNPIGDISITDLKKNIYESKKISLNSIDWSIIDFFESEVNTYTGDSYSSLRVSVFHGTLRARVYANQSSK